jgi:outer membrane biosynthesis protein TonB
MRITVTRVSWLLSVLALLPLMQGCTHKTQQAAQTQTLAPPIVDTPPPKPATVSPADLPPPVVTPPPPATPATDTTANTTPPPKKPAHHPKKTTPTTTTPAQSTQETASAAPTPSVSAIGELSSGASGDQRTRTEETIASTEKGVNGITRQLSDSEKKTDAQIHEFLKQAKEALNTGDVDGALSLANKAKVLLAELNQ